MDRYDREEIVIWPIEVWNEPNIASWAGTMEEYFRLYDYFSIYCWLEYMYKCIIFNVFYIIC
ncbi:hypothetical protein [Clostridium sp. DL-VIII]|uniref:GH39 family glycosyl hydrolase n=1 Tax=Clostridium sp. DL-VIII TaxID=641107 RepID=UPI001FA6D1A3|nr:hypothetical protein [Clostridium sp. DL-VIII]